MFYSEGIFGINRVVLDNKNRFVVPSFTGVSPGDELLLFRDRKFLSIYEKQWFLHCFSKFYSDDEVRNFYDQKFIYDCYCSDIFGSATIDKQKRLCLPQYVVDYYNYNNQQVPNYIFVKGAWDHINIFNEDFDSKGLIRMREK